jgi:hypothetical protein
MGNMKRHKIFQLVMLLIFIANRIQASELACCLH